MTCSQCGCSHTLAWHEETAAALAAVEKRAAQVERQYVTLNDEMLRATKREETVRAKLAEAERRIADLQASLLKEGEAVCAAERERDAADRRAEFAAENYRRRNADVHTASARISELEDTIDLAAAEDRVASSRAKLAEAELEIEAFKENQGILLEGLSDANACAERLRAASRALLKLTAAYWEARSSEGFSDEECAIGRAEENLEAALAHGPSSLAIAARIAEKERP